MQKTGKPLKIFHPTIYSPGVEGLPLAGDSTSCIALSSCWFKSSPHLTLATGGFEAFLLGSLSRCSPTERTS
jgi:hypothetical protein